MTNQYRILHHFLTDSDASEERRLRRRLAELQFQKQSAKEQYERKRDQLDQQIEQVRERLSNLD